MIKKILFGLLGLIVLLVIVGFFLPGKMEISRSISVNAPAEYAFEEVNDVEKWNNWSYWHTLDKDMKLTYGESKIGVGGNYSWIGNSDVGTGKCTIVESTPFKSIKVDLNFMENGTSQAWYTFEPEGESTKIATGMSIDFGMNPIYRWMGATMMKGQMEKAFDYGLGKIKELAEAKPKFSIPMSVENVGPMSYIGISTKMSPKDMSAVSAQMGKSYTELFTALKKSKVEPAGNAFCIYPSYSEESMEMICAVPVSSDAKLPAKYKVMQGPGGPALKAIHNGAYTKLGATHDQINKYIAFKNLEITGAPWEVYVTNPMAEKDTAKWVTEVYYPVKE